MLILEHSQVKFCTLQALNPHQSQPISGVSYNNKLFQLLDRYPLAEQERAIRNTRQLYVDTQGKRLLLVLTETDCISVWEEGKTLQIAIDETEQNLELVQSLDLNKLVAELRNIGGIDIRDRRYHLKIYPRCFIGSEAVDWFVNNLGINRTAAIALGQRLIDERLIHHVVDQHLFKDDQLFYRFYWDESRS
jgi:hypothetical protein